MNVDITQLLIDSLFFYSVVKWGWAKGFNFFKEGGKGGGAQLVCGKGRWPHLKLPHSGKRGGRGRAPGPLDFSWLCFPASGWWSGCQLTARFLILVRTTGPQTPDSSRVVLSRAGSCHQVAPCASRLWMALEPGPGCGTPGGLALKPTLVVHHSYEWVDLTTRRGQPCMRVGNDFGALACIWVSRSLWNQSCKWQMRTGWTMTLNAEVMILDFVLRAVGTTAAL